MDTVTSKLTLYAGTGGVDSPLGDNGPAVSAAMNPVALALTSDGSLLIADQSHRRIRRVDSATGIITTIAGNGTKVCTGDGGLAKDAGVLCGSGSMDVDRYGNVYFSDWEEVVHADNWIDRLYVVRKIDMLTGTISVFAEGGDEIKFSPNGDLFIADRNEISRVNGSTGVVDLVAGTFAGSPDDGIPAVNAGIQDPHGLIFDSTGNLLFSDSFRYSDYGYGRVRKIDLSTGLITTVWEWQPHGTLPYFPPLDMSVDSGGIVYATVDLGGYGGPLAVYDVAAKAFTPIAGGSGLTSEPEVDGVAATSSGAYPSWLTADGSGNLLIADVCRVRRAGATTGIIDTIARTSPGLTSTAALPGISSLLWEKAETILASAHQWADNSHFDALLRLDPKTGSQTILAGGAAGDESGPDIDDPRGAAIDSQGNIFYADRKHGVIKRIDAKDGSITVVVGTGSWGFGGDGGMAANAALQMPNAVTFDAAGNMFIADSGNNRIRRVDVATNVITTVAGAGDAGYGGDGGPATLALLSSPSQVIVDFSGNLYIADTENHRVRRVSATSGIISTVAGTGVPGFNGDGPSAVDAWLNSPTSIHLEGTNLFIADAGNSRVRMVGLNGSLGDFSIGSNQGSSTTATLDSGEASYALALIPVWGFYGPVSLQCSNAPAGTLCTVTPQQVTLQGTPMSVGVRIQLSSTEVAAQRSTPVTRFSRTYLPLWLPVVGFLVTGLNANRRRKVITLTVVVLLLALLSNCGGGSSSIPKRPAVIPGTYDVVVSASSNTVQRVIHLTLVVPN